MSQSDLFDSLPEPPPKRAFDGKTYEPERDHARLKGQLARVFAFMGDGYWHTIPEIAAAARGSQASVSARLRDLRKEKYGARMVEREHVGDGVFRYRLRA